MHLIELFLPLKRSDGSPQPPRLFGDLRRRLVDHFGGLTAFTRAPAEGLWDSDGEGVERDEIVILEVMADELDRAWWAELREELECKFDQDEILIRASEVQRL